MTCDFPEYRQLREGLLDAVTLDEAFARNVKALTVLRLETKLLAAQNTALSSAQTLEQMVFVGTELEHRMDAIANLYIEMHEGRDMQWLGFHGGLVRCRRPGLASERG